ncbi:glycosyltransferase [Pollutibacter soli]|uniref:glycosyltransferase n=1 Tax=Pollutibacter soli TaxID=3034157 RepID=UPI0030139947
MVSIIIPALNEGATIRKVIQRIRPTAFEYEIIVVDDNSTDNTVSEALKEGARVITSSHKGKGISMHEGMIAARYDIIVYLDADILTYPPDVVSILSDPLINDEADFVKSFFDRQAGRVTQLVAKPLLSIFFPELEKFTQPLSGMIASRKKYLERLEFENDYGVDIALLIDAYNMQLRIKEVSIGFIKNDMQSLESLSKMSRQVSRTILQRASVSSIENLETLSNIHAISDEMDFAIKESILNLRKIMIIDLDIILKADFNEIAAYHFGIEDDLRYINDTARDSATRLRKIAELFRGISLPELQAIADEVDTIKHAEEVIKLLRQNGYITILLSEGFDVVANHIKNRLGFDYCFSNKLQMKKGLTTGVLEFPRYFSHPEHGFDRTNILTYLTEKFSIPEKNIVFISNSLEDVAMLQSAGLGLATQTAPEEVRLCVDKILPDNSLLPLLDYATLVDKRKLALNRTLKRYMAGAGALAIGAIAGYYLYRRKNAVVLAGKS